ncbi:uncharacterized protein BO97DRAFT_60564 [Aspergillus homomorphus CBS 101889]|uniref:Uncharacterized protein n=1 Tax=Aspergillus homomorphus (strain CBS 101889) TaxID=1450537 RepID=A0A395HX91_ASPHC|nr:hypothetical protein BO97DRAFT_60564 [Aspergillus homomorphus CBS 101889]RAL12146.1 hypothetical protein BO97DRAFT_60564 [Aspergillus homomorphus CBS 101889]
MTSNRKHSPLNETSQVTTGEDTSIRTFDSSLRGANILSSTDKMDGSSWRPNNACCPPRNEVDTRCQSRQLNYVSRQQMPRRRILLVYLKHARSPQFSRQRDLLMMAMARWRRQGRRRRPPNPDMELVKRRAGRRSSDWSSDSRYIKRINHDRAARYQWAYPKERMSFPEDRRFSFSLAMGGGDRHGSRDWLGTFSALLSRRTAFPGLQTC